jgi:hypothetical protein
MSILQTLGTGTGYLKAGFLGFPKSGKSFTAGLVAAGVKQHLGLPGPVVMFDTETGSEYLAPLIKRETGSDLVGVRSRSFADLMAAAREAESIGASVLLVDSITHPWRELCDAYLKGVNEVLRARGKSPRQRMEFQDWANVKAQWAPWTDWYLNSKMHVIICGRAGYEYDFEEREDGSGKDLVKTGIKMKTEGEFGFEPSLLVEMERIMDMSGDQKRLIHRATVLGCRFNVLDGKVCDNPTYEFFRPHVEMLVPGAHAPVDTEVKTNAGINDDGDAEWQAERRLRKILCEEIEGEILKRWPGQTKDEKTAKLAAVEAAFNTTSWTKVESLDSAALRRGLEDIKALPSSSKEGAC